MEQILEENDSKNMVEQVDETEENNNSESVDLEKTLAVDKATEEEKNSQSSEDFIIKDDEKEEFEDYKIEEKIDMLKEEMHDKVVKNNVDNFFEGE